MLKQDEYGEFKSFLLKTKRGLGAEFPASGGQWGFAGGAPANLQLFKKNARF